MRLLADKFRFNHLQRSSPLSLFFAFSFAAALGTLAALLATFPSLPSEVPLLPAGEALTPKALLFLIPALALIFTLTNAMIADCLLSESEPAAAVLPTFMNVTTSLLLSISLFRTVKLYPTASLPFEDQFYPLLLPFIVAALFGTGLTAATEYAARRLRLFDAPHGPYPEVRAIPRLGAIPIFVSFAIAALALLTPDKHLLALLLGGGVITVIQSIDDLRPLPFWLQGIGHLLAALIIVAGGIGIEYIRNPLYPWVGEQLLFLDRWQLPIIWRGVTCHLAVLADILTFVWIFALVNIVDWLDGLDGLAAGVSTIAGVAIIAVSFIAETPATALLGTILVGTLTGFLPLNFFPARIYLGGGAFLLGYFLAVLSIFSGTKTGTAILVLSLPIVDAFYVIYRRIRERRSPFKGDTTHLHHRLLEKGLSQPQIVFLEWGVVALMAIAAVALSGFYKFAGFLVVLIGALLANRWLLRQPESRHPKEGEA